MLTFLSLIQRNPIVPYSSQGRQRNTWCNVNAIQSSSMKSLEINVFGRTDGSARATASRLEDFIKEQKVIQKSIAVIPVFVVQDEVWDKKVGAFRLTMVLTLSRGGFESSNTATNLLAPNHTALTITADKAFDHKAFSKAFH